MGQLTTDTQEKANLLNHYFVSVFHQSKGTTLPNMMRDDQGESEYMPTIDMDLAREHAEKLCPHKSAGLDRLHPRVLKGLADIIA